LQPRPGRLQTRRSILRGLCGGAVAAGFNLSSRNAAAAGTAGEKKLNFRNWDTYIGETTLDDFSVETGIEIADTYFSTNDELFRTIQQEGHGLDVIVPGSEYVERMLQAETPMLEKLDRSKLPNIKNIDYKIFNSDFEDLASYAVPYTWLVIGIGYRRKAFKSAPPDSWKVLFDSDQHAKHLALMGNANELFRIAFQYLGGSVNDSDPRPIEDALAMLKKQRARGALFHKDDGQNLLLSGACDLVMEYNGDIAQAMAEDNDIGFALPKEGSLLQCDTLCIPRGAPHPENAHKFINYILDAEAGAAISRSILYPTPNSAARRLMPAEYGENPAIFPDPANLAKCRFPRFLGDDFAQKLTSAYETLEAG
jgi:spermidine/putrescine transport system substrate-binding protein